MTAQSKDWDRRVLRYDPAAGDKDGSGVKILRDRIVIAKRGGECWQCAEPIVPGTRIRSEVAVVDGQMKRSRTCHDCCDAMAKAWTDNGDAIEARITKMREKRGY